MTDAVDSLTQYTNGFAEEQEFVAETQSKINAQSPVSSVDDAKRSVQPAMVGYINIKIKMYNFLHFVSDTCPYRCGIKSCQRLWILTFEKAIQLAYGT